MPSITIVGVAVVGAAPSWMLCLVVRRARPATTVSIVGHANIGLACGGRTSAAEPDARWRKDGCCDAGYGQRGCNPVSNGRHERRLRVGNPIIEPDGRGPENREDPDSQIRESLQRNPPIDQGDFRHPRRAIRSPHSASNLRLRKAAASVSSAELCARRSIIGRGPSSKARSPKSKKPRIAPGLLVVDLSAISSGPRARPARRTCS